MADTLESSQYRAYRTINRHDDRGEFIIRLNLDARRLLPHGCSFVAVRSVTGTITSDDHDKSVPEALAAVRPVLAKDDRLANCNDIDFCQLDMSLRVAIGVRGYDPLTKTPLADITGKSEHLQIVPVLRTIRPSLIDSWIGYQWMLFRVQRALSGDFETPICRVHERYLPSLGIHDGGVVIMESAAARAIRRLLGTDGVGDVPDPDFEQQLGVGPGLKLPSIYMDKSTRDQLKVVPGQVVWVRRELWSVLRREILKIASALVLVFLGIVVSLRDLGVSNWILAVLAMISVILLLSCAVFESRNAVRAD